MVLKSLVQPGRKKTTTARACSSGAHATAVPNSEAAQATAARGPGQARRCLSEDSRLLKISI